MKDRCSMLTYENFVAVLLGVIEGTDVNVAYTQELLDTHALGRSLSITCLPDGFEDDYAPEEPPLRAVLSFRWPPEFTVFSLRGGLPDGFDGVVDERILASRAGVGVDIDVTYTLPLASEQTYDLAALPKLTRAIYDLHASAVPSGERPVRRRGAAQLRRGAPAAHPGAEPAPGLADRRCALRRRPAGRYLWRALRRDRRCSRRWPRST